MIHRKDMRIRDPFLVTDRENHCYYLVMNGGTVEDKHPNDAVFLRRTEDLIHFEDPFPILLCYFGEAGGRWYSARHRKDEAVHGGNLYRPGIAGAPCVSSSPNDAGLLGHLVRVAHRLVDCLCLLRGLLQKRGVGKSRCRWCARYLLPESRQSECFRQVRQITCYAGAILMIDSVLMKRVSCYT